MKDRQIRESVLRELDWEPQVSATNIGVAVKDGIVTLSGFVPGWSQKYHAEHAARRVYGVRAVADDLEVRLPGDLVRPDPEIARAAAKAIDDRLYIAHGGIQSIVEHGHLTLEGRVDWQYEKATAEAAVRDLPGVRSVTNHVTVAPAISTAFVKEQIEAALERAAQVDARRITVEVEDSKVILRGNVRAWSERMEAGDAAWRAPGVKAVENEIAVVP